VLISSVILLLQETLEAALLISVLTAVAWILKKKINWLAYGLVGGIVLAFVYGANIAVVSEWFDYVGQEVVNALLQIGLTIFLVVFSGAIFMHSRARQTDDLRGEDRFPWLIPLCAALTIILAITREGAEVFIFLSGFLQQQDKLQAVILGGGIGFSIGISVGLLLFYSLTSLPRKWGLITSLILLALFAGNMLSQASLQLVQADWITSSGALWNSSAWIAENSITGQLLYAMVGYEATPSLIQIICYLAGATLVFVAVLLGKAMPLAGLALK
jgi:high-affinity iron transporter